MTCKFPKQTVSLGFTQTHDGYIYNAFGLDWPQGFSLACGGVSYTKKGVAGVLSDWNFLSALAARIIGLVDTITFMINLPLMLIVYTIFTVFAIANWILLGLFMICAPPMSPFSVYMKFLGIWALYYIPTLLLVVVLTILTPFQIVIPELTCYLLKIHEW